MVAARRRDNAVAQVLAAAAEALRRRGLTVTELFERSAVDFEPQPGQRSWAKPEGLGRWELVRALESLGLRLAAPDADAVCASLDPLSTGRFHASQVAAALALAMQAPGPRPLRPRAMSPVARDYEVAAVDTVFLKVT